MPEEKNPKRQNQCIIGFLSIDPFGLTCFLNNQRLIVFETEIEFKTRT
jgi:hypothetical protein